MTTFEGRCTHLHILPVDHSDHIEADLVLDNLFQRCTFSVEERGTQANGKPWCILKKTCQLPLQNMLLLATERSRVWPEGSLYNSYYTEVYGRVLLLSLDCSTLPLIRTLYCWVLNEEVPSTIFKIFGITRPGIKPRFPGPLANTLPTRPKTPNKKYFKDNIDISALNDVRSTKNCDIRMETSNKFFWNGTKDWS